MQLEPCPFCGAPAVGDENAYGTGYMVGCSADCVLSPYVELASEAEAIAAWNTRTPPTSQSDEALVTQADREASVKFCLDWGIAGPQGALAALIAQTRASARAEGRREGIEEAAKVAKCLVFNHRNCLDVADRIRALAEKQP